MIPPPRAKNVRPHVFAELCFSMQNIDVSEKSTTNKEASSNDSEKKESLSKDSSTEKEEVTSKETNEKITSPSSEDEK